MVTNLDCTHHKVKTAARFTMNWLIKFTARSAQCHSRKCTVRGIMGLFLSVQTEH